MGVEMRKILTTTLFVAATVAFAGNALACGAHMTTAGQSMKPELTADAGQSMSTSTKTTTTKTAGTN